MGNKYKTRSHPNYFDFRSTSFFGLNPLSERSFDRKLLLLSSISLSLSLLRVLMRDQ
ncbi:hypothetical protein HanXRQr2_Chr16g0766611 [Helianthus annuus]|uniref:Uncharacterized protein n=1 Tax=Helianthus annuus TaxID=4232 RepID=A0A9K3DW12_HELAN|nr:hypothetical protein HanXRQr2_Chr16g0766611 [Helianthus annuus]